MLKVIYHFDIIQKCLNRVKQKYICVSVLSQFVLLQGDSVVISCELRDNVGQPEFVFWYHNGTMINFQTGVSVVTSLIGEQGRIGVNKLIF